MKNIKIYFVLFILICLAFLGSCIEINPDIPKQIKIDNVVTVNFPEGSIVSTNPTVDKISDPDIKNIFDETVDLFDVANSISYQVKISIGDQPPNNDEIEVVLNLPGDFLAQKPQTNGVELFALTYQNGGEEILDNFELISSMYNSTNKTVTAKLPRWVFSNARNGNYETVLIIASTPGVSYKKSLKSGNDITEDCLASQISCPTGSCEVTSPYNPQRLHPVDKIIKPHWGTDYRAPVGNPVYAVADGIIIRMKTQVDKTGNAKGYGLYIVIRHNNKKGSTLYAHFSKSLVTVGQSVKQGQQIGESGNTGTSSGPHLHFEYVPNGEIVQSKFRINPFPCVTPASLASITTVSATNITENSATSGGNITNDGGGAITARGVCWSTSSNPTIALSTKTTDGTGTGSFTSAITGLTSGTTYYIRAYATNSAGTAYGNEVSFSATANLPTLTTTAVSSITTTTVSSGGNISADGGSAVTARGVCWATTSTPTIANNKTTNGTGSGSFTSAITGLTSGTTYYIRAYATNSIGTAYGNQVTTTTTAVLPVLTTTTVSAITSTTATSGGNITSDGGAAVTARGVCWSTSTTPTITGSKTTDGIGVGSFTSNLTGLVANTTYYLRAYATNNAGTAYGSQISFTTSNSVNLNLDGDWDSGGTQVRISGSSGYFIKFASGSNWSLASSLGFVSIGSGKLKNLSITSTRTWTCSELWWHKTNGVLDQVSWSPNGTLQMSADGNSITTYTTSPWDGSSGSVTFTRVGKKSLQLSKTSQQTNKIQGVD